MTNLEHWGSMLLIIFIFVLLLVAKLIKEKVPVLNKFIIPSALIAGAIGWVLSDALLGLFTRDEELLKDIVFHSMALGFIALSLKHKDKSVGRESWTSGAVIVMTYLFQGIVGMGIIWIIAATLKPDLFIGSGLLLPLGFGQGPGYASSIGESFSYSVTTFLNGSNLGLIIATIGFLWGGIFGVFLLNYYVRKYKVVLKQSKEPSYKTESVDFETVREVRVFDNLTMQLVMVASVYFAVYILIAGLDILLIDVLNHGDAETGTFAMIASLLRSFNFLFGILFALLFLKIQQAFINRGKKIKFLTNNFMLSNISNLMFNVMIVAAVLAIKKETVAEYGLEIILITTAGGILTWLFLKWITYKLYEKNQLEFFVGMYGMLTGTASTGIALLKGIDPDLETDVAENMVVGSATAALLGVPLLLIIVPMPVAAWVSNKPELYIIAFIALIVYFFILLGIFTWREIRYRRNKE